MFAKLIIQIRVAVMTLRATGVPLAFLLSVSAAVPTDTVAGARTRDRLQLGSLKTDTIAPHPGRAGETPGPIAQSWSKAPCFSGSWRRC